MGVVQVGIRFPADMKAWLEDQARLNKSSQNSEVVRSVRERMKATGVASPNSAPAAVNAPEQNHSEASSHAAE